MFAWSKPSSLKLLIHWSKHGAFLLKIRFYALQPDLSCCDDEKLYKETIQAPLQFGLLKHWMKACD